MRMKKSDIVRTHTCTMIIIALFFLEIKWYEEEFRKLAAALIVKKHPLQAMFLVQKHKVNRHEEIRMIKKMKVKELILFSG